MLASRPPKGKEVGNARKEKKLREEREKKGKDHTRAPSTNEGAKELTYVEIFVSGSCPNRQQAVLVVTLQLFLQYLTS